MCIHRRPESCRFDTDADDFSTGGGHHLHECAVVVRQDETGSAKEYSPLLWF